MGQYQDLNKEVKDMSINDDNSLSLSDYANFQMKGPNSTNIEWVHSTDDNMNINEDVDDDEDDYDDDDDTPKNKGPNSTNIEWVHSTDDDDDDDDEDDYDDDDPLCPDCFPQQMKELAIGGMKEEPLSDSKTKSNLEDDKMKSYSNNAEAENSWEIKAGYKDLPLLKFYYCPDAPFHGLINEIQKFKIPPKQFKLELQRIRYPHPSSPRRIQLKFAIIGV